MRRLGRGVKFQVAKNAGHGRAQLFQALCVGGRLRPHCCERTVSGPRQPGQPQRLLQGFFTHARVGQHQRDAAALARGHEIRPDLGLHQDADARFECREEFAHGRRRVPRLPDLDVAALQQRSAFCPPGRRAMREQQAHAGLA